MGDGDRVRMVSPVWYTIRRVGDAMYDLRGEHDVDVSWMQQVHGKDSRGDTVGRILPRFTVEGWDQAAYQELAGNIEAVEELIRIIVEQVKSGPRPPSNVNDLADARRKHGFDGVVMELAVPQFFETFFSRLSDSLHLLHGEKRIVVVIPPHRPGYASAEVRLSLHVLNLFLTCQDTLQSRHSH
jgi:hypothetical protein